MWLLGPLLSGNADPTWASPSCSQRGKTPLYCLHSSRFPLILMGLGLPTFQSRTGEAASFGTPPQWVLKGPLSKSLLQPSFFISFSPAVPPPATPRDTVNTRREDYLLELSQLLSSVPLVSKPPRTGLNAGCSN